MLVLEALNLNKLLGPIVASYIIPLGEARVSYTPMYPPSYYGSNTYVSIAYLRGGGDGDIHPPVTIKFTLCILEGENFCFQNYIQEYTTHPLPIN